MIDETPPPAPRPGFDLSILHGARVVEITFGLDEVHLNLHPDGAVGLSGAWELTDERGRLIDRACPPDERDAWRLHDLLGRRVIGSSIPRPGTFRLYFDNGQTLHASAYTSAYRAFSIHPDFEPEPGAEA